MTHLKLQAHPFIQQPAETHNEEYFMSDKVKEINISIL